MSEEIQNATPELLERLKNARPVPGFAFPGRIGIPDTDVSVVPGSGVHTFTDAELERLIAVVAEMQMAIAIAVLNSYSQGGNYADIVRCNAPSPTLSQVMEKYKNTNAGDTQS